jgi:hypothetical protein
MSESHPMVTGVEGAALAVGVALGVALALVDADGVALPLGVADRVGTHAVSSSRLRGRMATRVRRVRMVLSSPRLRVSALPKRARRDFGRQFGHPTRRSDSV